MSFKHLIKAMKLAPKCKYYTTVGGRTAEEIDKSEELLDIKFSKQSIEFYKKMGYLSFFGHEIFGINPNSNTGNLDGNSVLYALNDRKEYELPKKWLPIYNFGDGSMAYLDYSDLNDEEEPSVISAIYIGNNEYRIIEKVAPDLGEFLLMLVEESLE